MNGMGIGCQCGTCDDCWRNAGCPAVWPLPRALPDVRGIIATQTELGVQLTAENTRLKADLAQRDEALRLAGEAITAWDRDCNELKLKLAGTEAQLREYTQECKELREKLAKTNEALGNLIVASENHVSALEAEVARLEGKVPA